MSEVLDFFSGLRGNHVYVRFIDRADAEEALRNLSSKYHQLTPASISDVLPDNYGLYTISFYNKTGIPSSEVRREFSKFGEVKNLTGSLDVKGGRVFVSYKNKNSAVEALQAFFFRKDRYPNMKFALPRCEKDYFGCYCLKFYNKTGEVTEQQVLEDFGMYGEVVDVRGPGLFDVTGDDVYVRYKEKSSAEQALVELVGKYDSLCLAPPSDIQADKFGYFTITFVNDKCLSKSDVWYIFSKFGTVACVNGTFDCKKGRVFVSYKEKQGALNALETMLITKEYHLQVSKNSTVRKNDYNIVSNPKENEALDFEPNNRQERAMSEHKSSRERSCSRETSCGPSLGHKMSNPPPSLPRPSQNIEIPSEPGPGLNHNGPPPMLPKFPLVNLSPKNGLVKFNRNVEKDIFGYYCLSFLNEDGEISEKKVRNDFSKFGEVVSVRGALGKQKGHVFVRFRKKEAAENCLNCLNSFPLSEMSELFGKYLFLSPATPRDIDCDMWGLYSLSFLNLNMKNFKEIRSEFSKFGEIVRLQSGGGGNTDELVSISYADKNNAVKALQTHFTNKEFPYLDIAKGSSLLLVNSAESSDNEDIESHPIHHQYHRDLGIDINIVGNGSGNSSPINNRQVGQNSIQKSNLGPPLNAAPGAPIRHHNQLNSDGNGQINGHVVHGQIGQNGSIGLGHGIQHDDLFLGKNGGQNCGSDVVDELLKPLQSYFSIYRTGQYHSPTGEGLLGQLGVTPGSAAAIAAAAQAVALQAGSDGGSIEQIISGVQQQQQQQTINTPNSSPDKKYRIKNVKMPNGVNVSVPPPNMVSAPPASHQTASNTPTNRTPNRHQPMNFHSQQSPISHQPQQSSPRQMIKMHKNNTNGHFVNGHQRSNSSGACVVPVGKMNDVISSNTSSSINVKGNVDSTNGSSTFLVPGEPNHAPIQESNNISRGEFGNNLLVNGFDHDSKQGKNSDHVAKEHSFKDSNQPQLPIAAGSDNNLGQSGSASTAMESNQDSREYFSKSFGEVGELQENEDCAYETENNEYEENSSAHMATSLMNIEKDVFGFFSLCMVNKSKDLTERKVKIDFSRQVDNGCAEGQQTDGNNAVARVRGQFIPGETIFVCFFDKEMD